VTHSPSSDGHPPSFHGLGIAPALLTRLDALNFVTPTPIQHAAIPPALDGKDVMGIAQTGTGKTLAFGIPLLQRLAAKGGRGLIILPTRELALQVDETLQKLSEAVGMKTAVFIGGASMNLQRQMLRRNPRVLTATPGRLLDHLQQGTVTLKEVSMLVLDEADRMLDMGFAPQLNKILAAVPKDRQTMLFSATMPDSIVKMATSHMKLPLRIEVAPAGTTAERVEQELYIVQKADKLRLLEKVLTEYQGTVLVFSRTKHGAKKIARVVRDMGHTSAELHANRSQAQRREALDGFKNGKYRVLIATDIASRGIDVTGIELVINFDLPENPEDYVHRIGRTARAGREGKAISFASPDQRRDIRDIERQINARIPESSLPSLPAARQRPPDDRQMEDHGGFRGRSGPPRRSFGGSGGSGRGRRGGGGFRR